MFRGVVRPVSKNRFIKGAYMIKNLQENSEKPIADYAFEMLDFLKQRNTQWSLVFDVTRLQIHYKTVRNQNIQKITFSTFDFQCNAENLMLNIDKNCSNMIYPFEKYTTEKNRALLFHNTKKEGNFKNVPDVFGKQMADYPESLDCEK